MEDGRCGRLRRIRNSQSSTRCLLEGFLGSLLVCNHSWVWRLTSDLHEHVFFVGLYRCVHAAALIARFILASRHCCWEIKCDSQLDSGLANMRNLPMTSSLQSCRNHAHKPSQSVFLRLVYFRFIHIALCQYFNAAFFLLPAGYSSL